MEGKSSWRKRRLDDLTLGWRKVKNSGDADKKTTVFFRQFALQKEIDDGEKWQNDTL